MSFYIPGTKTISNTSNGYVGVNTTTPSYNLDVNGDINLSGNLLNNGSPFTPSSASTVTSGQSTQILFNQSGSSTGSYGLTFNSNSNTLTIGSSGSIFYNSTGMNFNSNLIPSSDQLTIGSLENPWKSIYISTGTVFIGPTGALQINSDGLIASLGGFASPYFQVGATNPGAGILLTQQNNLLYFQNELGVIGPVSVFNSSIPDPNDTYYSLTGNVGFGVTGPQQKIDVIGNIQASDTIFAQNFTGTNLHISSIEANNSTLNIATNNNSTNTVNIGTSNSTQTVNIGTVGAGTTTINLGGVGDTVNVAGNLVYVNSTTTEISNPQFIINQSGTNINNTGLTVSQNGGPTGAYILVNSASNAWTLKAGAGSLVTLNQDVSTSASVNFNTATLTNLNLNNSNIHLGTNSGSNPSSVSIAIGNSAGQTSQTDAIAIGNYAGNSSQKSKSIAIGDGAGQTSQNNNSIAIGNIAGQNTQSTNCIAIGDNAGYTTQYTNCIAIGTSAGYSNQGSTNGYSVAVGYSAGATSQQSYTTALGYFAGNTTQNQYSNAIGYRAGATNQGSYSVAIGYQAGQTNQSQQSIVINASAVALENTGTQGTFINPIRNTTGSNVMYYNPTTKEVTQNALTDLSLNTITVGTGTFTNLSVVNFTGTNVTANTVTASNTVSATTFTGTNVTANNVTTNKVIFDGVGSIYFQTGSATGCFITGLNYNTTGTEHYVYYNNTTKELSQSSPNYFYSYSTGSQQVLTGSNASFAYFQPVTFNVNNILYHTFQHTQGSSVFTGTFASAVTLQFTYSLQIHSTTNPQQTAAAVLYLDGSPIAGSYRSCTISTSSGEFCLTNTFLVNVPQGSHWFQLQVAATDKSVSVGGTPNIAAPTNSYTSANLCCTRVI